MVLYFRMTPREQHGLVHAAACPGRSYPFTIDARLRRQPRKCGIDVTWPFLVDDRLALLERRESLTIALPEAAVVHGDHVVAALGRPARKGGPRLPIAIALMQEDDPRSGLAGGVIRCLQLCSVGGGEGYVRGRWRLRGRLCAGDPADGEYQNRAKMTL